MQATRPGRSLLRGRWLVAQARIDRPGLLRLQRQAGEIRVVGVDEQVVLARREHAGHAQCERGPRLRPVVSDPAYVLAVRPLAPALGQPLAAVRHPAGTVATTISRSSGDVPSRWARYSSTAPDGDSEA